MTYTIQHCPCEEPILFLQAISEAGEMRCLYQAESQCRGFSKRPFSAFQTSAELHGRARILSTYILNSRTIRVVSRFIMVSRGQPAYPAPLHEDTSTPLTPLECHSARKARHSKSREYAARHGQDTSQATSCQHYLKLMNLNHGPHCKYCHWY